MALATNPASGGLYYIAYDGFGAAQVREIRYVNDPAPVAVASVAPNYGPAPLTVQLSGSDSFDPNGQPIAYLWDFGDGSLPSTEANPQHQYGAEEDITAQAGFIARVFFFNPPEPTGSGNHDPEVMRDGDRPPIGTIDPQRQYDTYHGNDQANGNFDYVGYTFGESRQITKLIYQEGMHFFDGGWWNTLAVQYRNNIGQWVDLPGVTITPPYAGNNGVNFETYTIDFPTRASTGMRLVGDPGGSANFVSVGELRVIADANLGGQPRRYDATLTVFDPFNLFSTAGVSVHVNNTPPQVEITSPVDGSLYPREGNTPVTLTASISDAEHGAGQLTCRWQSILHHNDHTHPEAPDPNCSTSAIVSGHGSPGDIFYFEFLLDVSDGLGLTTTRRVFMYPEPECPGDADFNLMVDFADIGEQLANWGMNYRPEPGTGLGDADGSGVVDFGDVASTLVNWGVDCSGHDADHEHE